MEYRNLGRSGLKVSALAFGAWVTFKNQLDLIDIKVGHIRQMLRRLDNDLMRA